MELGNPLARGAARAAEEMVVAAQAAWEAAAVIGVAAVVSQGVSPVARRQLGPEFGVVEAVVLQ